MFTHISPLLKLAGPMILSSSAITIMQIIDALVLSYHSSTAVAAMGPASMAVILFQGFVFGTAGYAGTFVAHNHGRGDRAGVRKAVWLGIHTAVISGIAALALTWPVAHLFLLAGHEAQVAQDEKIYFQICMAGSLLPALCAALGGWLSGTGRAVIVTGVTFISLIINALLAWGLVLGEWGLPRLGIAGAALATVSAQLVATLLYLLLFARTGGFTDRAARCFDWPQLRHFLSLAVPLGLRISGELTAWTLFLVAVGRLGTVELAASSIAFRINGTAFFPALGLGQAAGILVGHARGSGRDNDVPAIAWQSLALCELWMLAMALLFACVPAPLVAAFAGTGPESAQIVEVGVLTMRFVALYCLFDAANVVIGCVLAAAGETRWVARAFFIASCLFLTLLWLLDRLMPSLVAEWTLATLFVFATATVWSIRFRSGAWRRVTVLQGPSS
ncbi:MATE family efflux transporter [Trichlorobacter ammonificans]|uniref:Multidrug-efflux transporter n=1 Tax=Trichlorobacter ammonificans TaxID=2916410 RepID=A0ABN8HIA4_9BACT|nr:MATE family efflux transporter [Trichlorobacter ammonificans]CAH2032452.1 MATE efflux family protein [Trichlorobacter ammonificans]